MLKDLWFGCWSRSPFFYSPVVLGCLGLRGINVMDEKTKRVLSDAQNIWGMVKESEIHLAYFEIKKNQREIELFTKVNKSCVVHMDRAMKALRWVIVHQQLNFKLSRCFPQSQMSKKDLQKITDAPALWETLKDLNKKFKKARSKEDQDARWGAKQMITGKIDEAMDLIDQLDLSGPPEFGRN